MEYRLESTSLDYVGYAYDEEEGANSIADLEEITGSNNYSNILPNLTVQTKLSENFVLNGAYTVGIARPSYFELVPYQAINSADLEIAVGNPDLEATVSNNFDLMAEYYFSNVGLITGGVFVKNIDNWLYLFSDDDYQFRGESYARGSPPRCLLGTSIAEYDCMPQQQLCCLHARAPDCVCAARAFVRVLFLLK